MFLTGAIGIKIAIAKILGIADDVSELFSLLLNSKNCYPKPVTPSFVASFVYGPDSNPLLLLVEGFAFLEKTRGIFLLLLDE